jgi:hypothetical protein
MCAGSYYGKYRGIVFVVFDIEWNWRKRQFEWSWRTRRNRRIRGNDRVPGSRMLGRR